MTGHKKMIAVILALMVVLPISGCWDLRELQDRNFVMTVAIDSAEKTVGNPEVTRVETYTQAQDSKPLRLSFQVLKLTAPSRESKPAEATKTFVISNTGKSMFDMERDMMGQSSKALYFEHLYAIIISEDALKKSDLVSLLDFWLRDSEMRWRIKILVTSGEARQFLTFNPPSGESGGKYFDGIMQNQKKGTHIAGARTDLGFISQAIDNQFDVDIPRIEMADKTVKVGGAALFRQNRFVGYADEYTTRGMKLLLGTEKSAVIPVDCPLHPEGTIAFEMFHHDTRLTPHLENGNLYFTLDISMEGNLGEVSCRQYHDTADDEFIKFAELIIAEEIKRNTLHSYHFLQSMRVDPLRLAGFVKGQYPREWKTMKDHWDEIYPTAPLYVTVNVTIRGLGEHH